MKTKQFNVEVDPEIHRVLKAAAGLVGVNLGDLAADAFRWMVGDTSPDIEKRRQVCIDLARRSGKRSFDMPAGLLQSAA